MPSVRHRRKEWDSPRIETRYRALSVVVSVMLLDVLAEVNISAAFDWCHPCRRRVEVMPTHLAEDALAQPLSVTTVPLYDAIGVFRGVEGAPRLTKVLQQNFGRRISGVMVLF